MDYRLLKKLCEIHAPSGNERAMKEFIKTFVHKNSSKWKVKPEIIEGDEFQDCLILVFGKPRTAIFTHMDSIGFMVRYHDQLVAIGSPETETGYQLVGEDRLGPIECELVAHEHSIAYKFGRGIETGTELVFKPHFRETKESVQCCYLDNRLGVFVSLKVAETLENGIIVFSCWEEHGGGSVPFLTKYIYEQHQIKQALICDITWATEGVQHGKGVAISLRDRNIPRRGFIEKIVHVSQKSGIKFQLEVESGGSSDGREIQISPYPIDWCFVGAPESNVHSPDELVYKADIESMLQLYKELMKEI